jgi:C-terminal general transcription factor TFIIE alpha
MSDDDEDDDDMSPTVLVNGKSVNLLTVNDEVIAQMTAAEKEAYIHAYQDYYTNLYE